MKAIEITSKLISFKSITPEDDGAIDFLFELLQSKGFKCNLLKFGTKKNKIKNLYASFKGGDGPNLCFAGHTDVVPPGNISSWTSNPFDPIIKNGKIYGRGSSDMKGAIGSFLEASFRYIDNFNEKFDGEISFIITGDEEGEAKFGTKKVLEWIKKERKKIDFCIVGEPTNPNFIGEMAKIGRRGSLNGFLKVYGTQGHVAYPNKADNPINKAIKYCSELIKPLDKGNKIFQPSNLEITSIDVNNSVTNLIPGEVNLKFNVRFNNEFSSISLIKEIKKRLKKVGKNHEINIKVSGEPFYNNSKKLNVALIKSIKKVLRINPEMSTSGGTSDARFISKYCPVIEFGLVGKTMHKINENVDIKDIEDDASESRDCGDARRRRRECQCSHSAENGVR